MADRVLFQVIVPVEFHPIRDLPKSNAEDLLRSCGVLAADKELQSIDESSVKVIAPPALIRDFLTSVGINDFVEIKFHRGCKKAKTLLEEASGSNVNNERQPIKLTKVASLSEVVKQVMNGNQPDSPTSCSSLKSDSESGNMVLFNFTCRKDSAEEYANKLKEIGVGDSKGFGSVSIVGLELNRRALDNLETCELESMHTIQPSLPPQDMKEVAQSLAPDRVINSIKQMRDDIKATVRARIAMDQVITLISGASAFSFDYIMLAFVASVIAASGLVSNSSVIIVASMLVSPIMGPILGITFGITIHDFDLVKKGLKSEFAALLLCFGVGFFAGLVLGPNTYSTAVEDYNRQGNYFGLPGFPPTEMSSRGLPQSVLWGLPVAFFSGIGVALSVLGNNTTSLVGVAISASLLPPVVNTGLLVGFGVTFDSYVNTSVTSYNIVDDKSDLFIMAGWSLMLTVSNIVLIFIAGTMMFRIKEVRRSDEKTEFWAAHIEATRKYNRIKGNDSQTDKLFEEVAHQIQEEEPDLFINANNGYDVVFGDTPRNGMRNRWKKFFPGNTMSFSPASDSKDVETGLAAVPKRALNAIKQSRFSRGDLKETLQLMASKRKLSVHEEDPKKE
mmetsp:Transcript_11091/g.12692  ORF Transcript_11091/g.12692 Transcript_11091/m.12692 type:complete len:617 (+) Transcript_11091:99-1949(+)